MGSSARGRCVGFLPQIDKATLKFRFISVALSFADTFITVWVILKLFNFNGSDQDAVFLFMIEKRIEGKWPHPSPSNTRVGGLLSKKHIWTHTHNGKYTEHLFTHTCIFLFICICVCVGLYQNNQRFILQMRITKIHLKINNDIQFILKMFIVIF